MVIKNGDIKENLAKIFMVNASWISYTKDFLHKRMFVFLISFQSILLKFSKLSIKQITNFWPYKFLR